MDFAEFGLNPELLRGIKELGFLHPTPIQRDAIPPALLGKDLLACAATGSGKTAAFVLPILHRLMPRPRAGTRVLVITPTRELCAQIAEHLSELAVHTPIEGAAIYGGVGMGQQEHALRRGVDVVVATPGRLLDHMRFPYVRFDKLEVLVIDEADRMLDMGFLPDIRRILKKLPVKRQTLFFSATMPPEIAKLAQEMLKSPVMINQERRAAPPPLVQQAVYPVPGNKKAALLMALLQRGDVRSVIVFTRTKARTNRLTETLEKHGIDAARIHGNRSQSQREKALAGFKGGRVRVLIATDIASRGIDVEELSHVINFDVPHVPEDYIHRVGRTGRAGATGDAVTFCSPEEKADLHGIEKAIGARLPRVFLPDFDYEDGGAGRSEFESSGKPGAGDGERRSPQRRPQAPRRDDRKPAPRDDRRPAPRSDRGPAPKPDRRPPQRDDRRPPPKDDRRPPARDDRRPPPRDDRRPPPADDRRPPAAGGARPPVGNKRFRPRGRR